MGRREQRGRTTPGSKVTLGSERNQAQDHALRGGHCAFSVTPPYQALWLLVSFVMSPSDTDKKSHVVMFIDITRAHPHCTTRRQLWVQLPAEDPRSEEEGVCGLLLRSIYGLRDAGMNFEQLTSRVRSWTRLVSRVACGRPASSCIVKRTCKHTCTVTTS